MPSRALESRDVSPMGIGISHYGSAQHVSEPAGLRHPDVAATGSAANRYLDSRSKRGLDISVVILVLLVITPVLALILALVRLTSRGPSVFKQVRNGKDRSQFLVFKVRSMYHAQQPPGVVEQATRADLRITKLGRLLRKTSIDELPQLFNVLRGEMSLVGPRPHAVAHDEYFLLHVPNYADRFAARPGITGLAQVSGARGATPEVSDMQRRVDLDLEYLRTASLTVDCKILLRTAREVIVSKAAY